MCSHVRECTHVHFPVPAMATACVEPRPLYRPRDPRASDLWRLLDEHFDSFQQVYDERFQEKYGYWRPIVEQSVAAFLKCGDLQEGFARVRCPDCKHEMFVAFSCKQRCTCPSCHQKRTLLTSFDLERLLVAWQDAVFELYLAEEKIEPAVVENMRSWEHSGFSRPSLRDGARQSVFLPAGDQAGIERLIQYMTRCPFSLSRLVKVSDTGQVVYQAEKQTCRAFPDPKGDGTQAGVPRNFQILEPLDFLAEFTQHIPPKGSHLIRYYGWYSNKSRGMRMKAEAEASATAETAVESSCEETAARGSSQAWAMLIKRVYEVDPLCCPECGGQMQVVSFIEPPQSDVHLPGELLIIPTRIGTRRVRIDCGVEAYFACIDAHFLLGRPPLNSPPKP